MSQGFVFRLVISDARMILLVNLLGYNDACYEEVGEFVGEGRLRDSKCGVVMIEKIKWLVIL